MKSFLLSILLLISVNNHASMQCLEEVRASTPSKEGAVIGSIGFFSWFGKKKNPEGTPKVLTEETKPVIAPEVKPDPKSWESAMKRLEGFKKSRLSFVDANPELGKAYAQFESAMKVEAFLESFPEETKAMNYYEEFFRTPFSELTPLAKSPNLSSYLDDFNQVTDYEARSYIDFNLDAFNIRISKQRYALKPSEDFASQELKNNLKSAMTDIKYASQASKPWSFNRLDGTTQNYKSFQQAYKAWVTHSTNVFYKTAKDYLRTLPEGNSKPKMPSKSYLKTTVSKIIYSPEKIPRKSYVSKAGRKFGYSLRGIDLSSIGLPLLSAYIVNDALKKPKRPGCTDALISKNFKSFFQSINGTPEYDFAKKTLATCVAPEDLGRVCNELIQHQTNQAREKAWAQRTPASDEV